MEGFNGYVKAGSLTTNTDTLITCHNSKGQAIMCNTFEIMVSGAAVTSGTAFLLVPSSLIDASAVGTLAAATLAATSGYIGTVLEPGQRTILGAGRYVSSFGLRNLGPTATVIVNYGVTNVLNALTKYPLV